MINFTTPTLYARVKNIDFTSGYDVYVSLEQGGYQLDKSTSDLTLELDGEDTLISFVLSQKESASFDFNAKVFMQINIIDGNGYRAATGIKTIPVMRNLLDKEISYGG